ncbi:MAG: cation:proton antiporter, partial [Clostridia bacterium]
MTPAPYELLLPLALILLTAKVFSLVGKKIGLPAVVGMILAGIVLGFIKYIPGQTIFTSGAGGTLEGLSFMSKIGVVLIMFSAGIGTDLQQFKKVGLPSVVITSLGVIFPLLFGWLVATAFNGDFHNLQLNLLSNLFYGAILAATSVSITVAALKELGKLNTKVGMSIIAAAILDDIIGIILLSLFIGLDNSQGVGDIGIIIGKMVGFFVAAIAVGLLIRFLFKKISKRHPKTRRIPILSLVFCFFYAFAAEKWFGVADITGAYVAGLMLAGLGTSEYVDSKVETTNYLIFAPVFFATIGINANFGSIDPAIVGFGFAFVAAGIAGKLFGCGFGALICRYSVKDSIRVGLGMMVRAEVVLVCTQKGVENNMVDPNIMPFVLILIIVTTLLTPLLLKLSYRHDDKDIGMLAPPTDGGDIHIKTPDEVAFSGGMDGFDVGNQVDTSSSTSTTVGGFETASCGDE